jgi:hypothetical protein
MAFHQLIPKSGNRFSEKIMLKRNKHQARGATLPGVT